MDDKANIRHRDWTSIPVIEALSHTPIYVGTNKSLEHVIRLVNSEYSHILVTIGGKHDDDLAGIISRYDIVRAYSTNFEDTDHGKPKIRSARDIMTPFDSLTEYFRFLTRNDLLGTAAKLFVRPVHDKRTHLPHMVSALPIMDNAESHTAIGLITIWDVLEQVALQHPSSLEVNCADCITHNEQLAIATSEYTIGALFSYFAITKTKLIPIVTDFDSMVVIGAISDESLYSYLGNATWNSALDVEVGQIMQHVGKLIIPETPLSVAIDYLLERPHSNALIVVDNLSTRRLLGILSYADVMRKLIDSISDDLD